MSIFGQFKGGAEPVAAAVAIESLTATADVTQASADPLQEVDPAFAQERQQAELNADGGQVAEATDTNADLPEGEFGTDPKPTGNDDVKVDADTADVKITNEADDIIGDDDEIVDDRELDDLDTDANDIEMLAQQMSQLAEAQVAIEDYGIDKASMKMMQISGLLAGTALEALAIESVTTVAGDAAESQLAIEALGEKIKEKSASFAAKILSVVKGGGEKITAIVKGMWNKITGLVTKLTSKAWDATKSAGATIKAHPYATVVAVISAIAAVAGIVALAGGAPAMGSSAKVIRDFFSKVAGDINSKVKWPFGKVAAKVNTETLRLTLDTGSKAEGFIAAPVLGTQKLGWTQQAVKAVQDHLGRAWSAFESAWTATSSRTTKLATSAASAAKDVAVKTAKATGKLAVGGFTGSVNANMFVSKTVGDALGGGTKAQFVGAMAGNQVGGAVFMAYCGALVNFVVILIGLVRLVVVGGFRIIAATLRAVGRAVGVGGSEPVAA